MSLVAAVSRRLSPAFSLLLLVSCSGCENDVRRAQAAKRSAFVSRGSSSAAPAAQKSNLTAPTRSAPMSPSSGVGRSSSKPNSVKPIVVRGRRCVEQRAQEFLLRKGQIAKIGAKKEERERIEAARKRAIDYRTRHYGRFPGFGSRSDNPHPPRFYAKRTKFMSHVFVVHEKIVPALGCVEAALKRDCAAKPYKPRGISGLRLENTYKDYEVSNHVYGIAIDIDSQLNPCCGCVGRWSENPACKKKVKSIYERMAMPKCWVEVFERYGFYWLGHDELQDTMHFEFLGDPEKTLE